jgi:hypothetical protein
MTRDESRQASSDARLEHVRRQNLKRQERELLDRERKHIAALVGPGHVTDLAADAPIGADPRYDQTGFSGGLI